jgi:addiction module HigA family antidote
MKPGEVLLEEYLKPLGWDNRTLAKHTGLELRYLDEIADGSAAIDGLTARKFSEVFGTTKQFWLNLQSSYDQQKAKDGDQGTGA